MVSERRNVETSDQYLGIRSHHWFFMTHTFDRYLLHSLNAGMSLPTRAT